MFEDLPEDIKNKILAYLQSDQFTKAKKIMDEYYANHPQLAQQLANY